MTSDVHLHRNPLQPPQAPSKDSPASPSKVSISAMSILAPGFLRNSLSWNASSIRISAWNALALATICCTSGSSSTPHFVVDACEPSLRVSASMREVDGNSAICVGEEDLPFARPISTSRIQGGVACQPFTSSAFYAPHHALSCLMWQDENRPLMAGFGSSSQ